MLEKLTYLLSSFVSSLINLGKRPPENPEHIVLVKLDEIGDMLYTLHCMRAVADCYPNAEITVVCKPVNIPLVRAIGFNNIVKTRNQAPKRCDLQVDFRGNVKSLLYAFLGASYYLERGSIRLSNKLRGYQLHEVETNNAIIADLLTTSYVMPHIGLPPSYKSTVDVTKIVQLINAPDYVLMHIGAREPERRWPIDRFAEIIDFIHDNYGLKTYLIGAPNETALNDGLIQLTPNAVNLAGKTNLLELAYLIEQCHYFIGNESGPLHFAITAKRPLIALFGQGVRNVFYPLYENQHVLHHFYSDNDLGPGKPVETITSDEVKDLLQLHFPAVV